MPLISPKVPGNLSSLDSIVDDARTGFRQTQDQINAGPTLRRGRTPTGRAPGVMRKDDLAVRNTTGGLEITVGVGKGTSRTMTINEETTLYLPPQSGSGAPTAANFPAPNNYGWYRDTGGSTTYFSWNDGGTLRQISISTLDGSITAGQHGNLSGAGPFHAFTGISGTITDAQHGSRAGGTLHAVATTAAAGFMSTTHFDMLDDATTTALPGTLVLRGGGGGATFAGTLSGVDINATGEFQKSSTKVLGARITGWGAPTGTTSRSALTVTASAGYVQAEFTAVIEALKALIADCRTHGFIGN